MTGGAQPKERPILFSGPMVRAILDGRKTQTRRPVKFHPNPYLHHRILPITEPWEVAFETPGISGIRKIRCRYGQPGDLLWVRETWTPRVTTGQNGDYIEDGFIYRADVDPTDAATWRWRPSIHMPRRASRITLRVTGVRVERIQEISNGDAIAEGCGGPGSAQLPKQRFSGLWDNINAKRPGYSWSDNPWCWAIEFEVTK